MNKDIKNLTPEQMVAQRDQPSALSMNDVLRAYALGLSPNAPRLPEQALQPGSFYGGYLKGYTSKHGFKGGINFSTLRQVAERSGLLASIVSTRQHQATRYCKIAQKSKKGEVGFNVKHKREAESDFRVPEGFKELCRQVEDMILAPWKVYWNDGEVVYKGVEPSMSSFMSKVVDDLLVLNRPVIELGLDFFKTPRQFGAIDGACVIPTFSVLKFLTARKRVDLPKDWNVASNSYRLAMQKIADNYKIDVNEKTEYLYVLAGRPVAGFKHDQLIISPQFPTTNVQTAGYPRSLVEKAIYVILDEITAMQANSRFFEFGSMAEVILALKGSVGDQHVKDLEQILQANMTGINGMYRVPLIATPNGKDDLDVVQLKQNHRDMMFDVYIQKLTNLACAIFRMHPSEINEAPRAGDNSGSLNQASQKQQINMSQEQGLEAMLMHIKSIFDEIIQRVDPNLVFEWDYGRNERDQLDTVSAYAPIATVDERRKMMSMEPLGPEKGGDVVDNTFIMQAQQQAQQAQAQNQQDEQQPDGQDGDQDDQDNDGETWDERIKRINQNSNQ